MTTFILPRKSTVGGLFRNELKSPVEEGAFFWLAERLTASRNDQVRLLVITGFSTQRQGRVNRIPASGEGVPGFRFRPKTDNGYEFHGHSFVLLTVHVGIIYVRK